MAARPFALTPEAVQALSAYDWPGNVRELERTLEGALTTASTEIIDLDALPRLVRSDFSAIVRPSLARGDTLRAWACRYVHLVLSKCDGNKRRACELLGISYHTLQSYLAEPCWARPGPHSEADASEEEATTSGANVAEPAIEA